MYNNNIFKNSEYLWNIVLQVWEDGFNLVEIERPGVYGGLGGIWLTGGQYEYKVD